MRERIGAAVGVAAYLAGVGVTLAVLFRHAAGAAVVRPAPLAAVLAALGAVVGASGYRRVELVRRRRATAALLAVPVASGTAVLGTGLLGTGGLGVELVGVEFPGTGAVDGAATLALAALSAIVASCGVVVLRRTASTLHARRRMADALFLVELPATTRTPTRRVRALAGLLGVAALAGAGAAALAGSPGWLPLGLLAAPPLAVGLRAPRDVWITEAGVLFESSAGTRLLEWDDLEGYDVGERLVLLRSGALRRDVAFDAGAVSGPALAVLGDLLPRSETRTASAGGVDASVGESPDRPTPESALPGAEARSGRWR